MNDVCKEKVCLQIGDVSRPATNEIGLPEEPEQHDANEEESNAGLVPGYRSKLLVLVLYYTCRDLLTLGSNVDSLGFVAIRSEHSHVHDLQPEPG